MKSIKKILLIVVLIASVLPLVNISYAQTVYGENEKVLLDKLGILEHFKQDEISEDKIITRAEFADVLARMNGERYTVFETSKNSFLDVSNKHFAYNAINFVSTKRYMIGYEDFCFYPEKNISITEAIKAITIMLGYDTTAEIRGGYYVGYLSVAGEIGILDNVYVSTDSLLTYKDLKQIIYNTLFAKIQTLEINGADKKLVQTEEIAINRFFGIYEIEGIVSSNAITALSDCKITNENEIAIDDVVLKTENDYSDLFGFHVKAYYKEIDDNEKEIFYIEKSNKNTVTRIYGNDIYSFELNTIMYENEETHGKIKLEQGCDIFKNNKLFDSSYNPENLFVKTAFISFVDNDKDGKAEVVLIEEGILGIVQKIDIEDKRIFNKLNSSDVLKINDYNTCEIIDENGQKIKLENLKVGDVYTSYKTSDKYIKIIKSSEKVNGVITGVTEDGVIIGGVLYKFNLNTYSLNYFKVGVNVTLYLDHNKLIVSSQIKSNEYSYGYIKRIWNDTDNEMLTGIKLLKEDGKFEIFNVEKLYIDKKVFKNTDDICSYIDAIPYKLVRYKLNDDGVLNEIDTVKVLADSSKDSLKVLQDCYSDPQNIESYKYVIYHRSFYGKGTLGNNVKIFVVPPEEMAADEDYAVKDISYIKNEENYSFVSFNSSCDGVEAEALLLFGEKDDKVSYRTGLTLVSEVNEIINDDDEIICEIMGYTDGNAVTVYMKNPNDAKAVRHADNSEKTSPIEKGDIVRVTKDSQGYIIDIDMLYDKSVGEDDFKNGFLNNGMLMGGYYEVVFVTCGKVYGVYSDVIQVAQADYNVSLGYNLAYIDNFILGSFKILVVEDNEIREGTKVDIYDYVHNSSEASDCIIYQRWGQAKMLIIYK